MRAWLAGEAGGDAPSADLLLAALPGLDEAARERALDALVAPPDAARELLDAYAAGVVPRAWLGRERIELLTTSRDAEVAARASELFGE